MRVFNYLTLRNAGGQATFLTALTPPTEFPLVSIFLHFHNLSLEQDFPMKNNILLLNNNI